MKVWNYIFIALSMMVMFELAGYPTAFEGIFSFVNLDFNANHTIKSFSLDFSNIADYIFNNLGLLLSAGIAVGLYLVGKPEIAIKAGLATAIFSSFIPTLYFALTHALEIGVSAWAIGILGLIFIPFSVMFFFALLEWVFGGTSD